MLTLYLKVLCRHAMKSFNERQIPWRLVILLLLTQSKTIVLEFLSIPWVCSIEPCQSQDPQYFPWSSKIQAIIVEGFAQNFNNNELSSLIFSVSIVRIIFFKDWQEAMRWWKLKAGLVSILCTSHFLMRTPDTCLWFCMLLWIEKFVNCMLWDNPSVCSESMLLSLVDN